MGYGEVVNTLRPQPGSTEAILGAGIVLLLLVRLLGSQGIVIDNKQSRLEMVQPTPSLLHRMLIFLNRKDT